MAKGDGGGEGGRTGTGQEEEGDGKAHDENCGISSLY